MKYWEDMQEKWGFGDGDAVPDGIEEYRKVYIAVVNAYAEKFGSEFRYVTFDRSGVHNWCMVIVAKKGETDDQARERPEDLGGDEILWRAVQAAYEVFPDEAVDVDVSINRWLLEKKLEDIKAEAKDG